MGLVNDIVYNFNCPIYEVNVSLPLVDMYIYYRIMNLIMPCILQGAASCTCGNDYSMFDEAVYDMMMAAEPCWEPCIGGGDGSCGAMDQYSIYSYGTG